MTERDKVEQLYKKAKKRWEKMNVPMVSLSSNYYKTLKWLLEVTLDAPEFNFDVPYNPVVMGKKETRRYYSVYYNINETDSLLVIFSNNEIAFYPNASLDMAKRLVAAFNKWCDLIEEKAFCGTRL
jgi:hypothetical protein